MECMKLDSESTWLWSLPWLSTGPIVPHTGTCSTCNYFILLFLTYVISKDSSQTRSNTNMQPLNQWLVRNVCSDEDTYWVLWKWWMFYPTIMYFCVPCIIIVLLWNCNGDSFPRQHLVTAVKNTEVIKIIILWMYAHMHLLVAWHIYTPNFTLCNCFFTLLFFIFQFLSFM